MSRKSVAARAAKRYFQQERLKEQQREQAPRLFQTLGAYEPDDILSMTGLNEPSKLVAVPTGKLFSVRMDSPRYECFKRSKKCVACGIEGEVMLLQWNLPRDSDPEVAKRSSPHFNLYAVVNGNLVLMTRDHIVPKADGGQDVVENLQTMCHHCNGLKGTLPNDRFMKLIAEQGVEDVKRAQKADKKLNRKERYERRIAARKAKRAANRARKLTEQLAQRSGQDGLVGVGNLGAPRSGEEQTLPHGSLDVRWEIDRPTTAADPANAGDGRLQTAEAIGGAGALAEPSSSSGSGERDMGGDQPSELSDPEADQVQEAEEAGVVPV